MKVLKYFIFLFVLSIISSSNCNEIIKAGKVVIQGIVVPEHACPGVNRAATELAYHFKKASGVDISIIEEKSTRINTKYIYLGNCRKARLQGIEPEKYPRNAGVIRIDKDNIFIAGNDGTGDWKNNYVSLGTLFATYTFMEKYLGVRWLWPGKLGEIIPRHENIILPEGKEYISSRLQASRWRTVQQSKGWASEKNFRKFSEEELIWLKRHRFSFDSQFELGHAFTQFFKRFGKKHPEFFSLLPDGTRRSNPYDWSHGAPSTVSMCVTCPALIQQIIADWKAKSPRPNIINLNENDTTGDCVCQNCLTADASPLSNKVRFKHAKKRFIAKEVNWIDAVGSVSDRYCKFYLAVQKKADLIDPKQRIMGLIYANYSLPPTSKIKLNERIILRFCPPYVFPWTKGKISDYKKIWSGWARTNAKLMFRPNFTTTQCFPIMYQDVFYDLFNFSCKNGMIASDMDSLTGHYAVQGPVNYVIANLNHDDKSSLKKLENDYFSAFGKAKDLVRQYFEFMKRVSMQPDFSSPFSEKTVEGGLILFDFFLIADSLFTPNVMHKANEILTQAASIPDLSPICQKRVEFLRIGLKHAELVMNTQAAFKQYQKNRKIEDFKKAFDKLCNFRKSVEASGAINMGDCYFWEKRHWPLNILYKQ